MEMVQRELQAINLGISKKESTSSFPAMSEKEKTTNRAKETRITRKQGEKSKIRKRPKLVENRMLRLYKILLKRMLTFLGSMQIWSKMKRVTPPR